MSIYTPLSPSQLRQLPGHYELGEILDYVLRFWLSRLLYIQSRNGANLPQDKNPDVLKYLLLKHRENAAFCLSLI
ncbi:MAG: hypothetical protein QNL62_06380 [Gammaproteobacteria bacterium]|nr:hypothetical protein [Gammaproteobacteria bacterium]